MAVQVEPPRWRPRSPEPARYPGLTPEERGYEVAAPVPPDPEPLPGTPLWVAPSELPPPGRSQGFVVDRAPPPAPPLPETEGLFDVPGLLERLWLARALEARRAPSSSTAASLPQGPGPEPAPAPAATVPPPSARPRTWLRSPGRSRPPGRRSTRTLSNRPRLRRPHLPWPRGRRAGSAPTVTWRTTRGPRPAAGAGAAASTCSRGPARRLGEVTSRFRPQLEQAVEETDRRRTGGEDRIVEAPQAPPEP